MKSVRSLTFHLLFSLLLSSLHIDMADNMVEKAGEMKESVVETLNGFSDKISDEITKIPLKESMTSANHLLEENLENLKNEMMNKAQSIGDETEKLADELIKETEDLVRDAETGIVDMKNEAVSKIESVTNDVLDELNMKSSSSPTHSTDTIRTSVPEPEIERILKEDGIKTMDESSEPVKSPEATVDELENLEKTVMTSEETPSAPETEEPKPVEADEDGSKDEKVDEGNEKMDEEKPVVMKNEDDLVVEDIKDE